MNALTKCLTPLLSVSILLLVGCTDANLLETEAPVSADLGQTGANALTSPVASKAATSTTNLKIPLPQPFQVFIPCAAGGAGELVEFSGTLHVLFHTTLDGDGGFHTVVHSQPQGVVGIGQTTGDQYQGTGVSQETFNDIVGSTTTIVNNFRLIGHGPGNNLLVHQTLHATVNANGEVTASVDNVSFECK